MYTKQIFILAVFSMCYFFSFSQDTTIYSFKIDSISGSNKIDFSKFQNKKILIVITATLDKNFSQLHDLDVLQKRHRNDLVVVIFPSNDFSSEPANNDAISLLFKKLDISCIVAAKTSTRGKDINKFYSWISRQSLVGIQNLNVTEPFQKFLFNSSGRLTHMYSASTKPLSSTIQNAISE